MLRSEANLAGCPPTSPSIARAATEPADRAVPVAAGPIGEAVDSGAQGRCPEQQRRGGAEGGAGEDVARVVDAEADAADGEHGGEAERDPAPGALAQEDRH